MSMQKHTVENITRKLQDRLELGQFQTATHAAAIAIMEQWEGKAVNKRVGAQVAELLPDDITCYWSTNYGMYSVHFWGKQMPYPGKRLENSVLFGHSSNGRDLQTRHIDTARAQLVHIMADVEACKVGLRRVKSMVARHNAMVDKEKAYKDSLGSLVYLFNA